MALFLELPELRAILKEGPLTYLTQFQSISIVRTQNGQEQLRISGGSFYCTRDHQIVRGSIRPGFVKQGFGHWCPGIEYPRLEPGQAASVPRNAIDFPRLLEWLGNSLDGGYMICQQRLERCRGFGTSGTGAAN
ncbi:hypothetical protein GYB59_01375 [bacterium]|nr:hypothetical protein [bacterium]